jgi:hypothetical protein
VERNMLRTILADAVELISLGALLALIAVLA